MFSLTLDQVLESRAILIFDSCERLRSSTNVTSRLLDALIRLSELSKLNISVIFISPLPWSLTFARPGFSFDVAKFWRDASK